MYKFNELYNLDSFDDVLGQDDALQRLRDFAKDIEKKRYRIPLILFGPPGTGKTIAVHLLAREFGWNVVELNASDYREKEVIEKKLLSAATSRTLFAKRNLILLDEIDELAPRFDRGAGAGIGNLITNSKNPIIFIANDRWNQSISFLREKTEPVEFKRLDTETVVKILLRLCKKFSIDVETASIDTVASRSNGDARSAINDLSVIIGSEEDMTEIIGLRDRKIDIFRLLDNIFMMNTITAPLRAIMNTDLSNDMLIRWIEENIPKRYEHNDDMHRAFDSLASASMFSTRAVRAQYYTYWRYMNVFMSSGVALAKEHYPSTRARYAFPKIIKELGSSKVLRKSDAEIAKKLQRVFHTSVSRIARNEMRVLAKLAKSAIEKDGDEKIYDELASTYGLEDKEIEHLIKNYG